MKLNIFLLLSSLSLMSCTSSSDFTITGHIDGAKNGTLYLQKEVSGVLKSIDSVAMSKDGKFSFKGDIESPEVHYITFGGTNPSLSFFVEQGKINITAKVDSLPSAKVIGGPNQELYTKFTEYMRGLAQRQQDVYIKVLEFSIDGADKDSLIFYSEKYNTTQRLQTQFIANFAITNPGYEIAPMIAYTFLNGGYSPILDSIVNIMSPQVATSKYGKEFSQYVHNAKATSNGMISPEFKLIQDGQQYTPQTYKGKMLLLVVWGAGDPQNTEFLEALKPYYEKWRSQGFEILSTCISENKEDYQYDLYTLKMPWTEVYDGRGYKNEIVQKFAISGSLPSTILIAPDGIILGRNISGQTLDNVMEIFSKN